MRRVYRLTWLWSAIIMLSALAAGLVTFVFPGTVVRPALVMWFLFVCPGMTVVRFFRLADIVVDYTLAIAISFAIDAFIAGIMLYAGWWLPARILGILMGFCLIGASMQLVVIDASAAFKLKPAWIVPRIQRNKTDPENAWQASQEDAREG